jgi:hypothetical protein
MGKVYVAVDDALWRAMDAAPHAVGNKAYVGVLYGVYDRANDAVDRAVWLAVDAAVDEALNAE